ncbi:MAG: hypothetical protein A2571_00370 [Candidatus Vogelbacteria bacterium RIFOXYD1_FULL_44_32]|uniref:Uncharacterized protein n=1 Tax=Candidatus Vogelbacteria bacterium RIFOXYD1_FULL_44_32 TaxID=1802438 RepID=A0A1G2QE15_9BACT|nr:MAG: hypothetical protein A2571_00370 [Candidatus Vogelbacteria bacterium RIFOXYD1_FULL_44_32]
MTPPDKKVVPDSEPGITSRIYSDAQNEVEEIKKRLLNHQKGSRPGIFNQSYNTPFVTRKRIAEKIEDKEEQRAKSLANDALEQDISLKKVTLNRLFIFLGIETTVIFILAFLQGVDTNRPGKFFYLEDWSFRLLVTATISQITIMLLIAVKHLFPENNQKSQKEK